MSAPISDQVFKGILENLSHFGEAGHERIAISNDDQGNAFPKVVAKARGFRRILEFFYKPWDKRSDVVAERVMHFLYSNKQQISTLVQDASGQELINCTFTKLSKLLDRTTIIVDKKPIKWKDWSNHILPSIKFAHQKAVQILNEAHQNANGSQAAGIAERNKLIREGEKIKQKAEEEAAKIKRQAVAVTLNSGQSEMAQFRNRIPNDEDVLYFIAKSDVVDEVVGLDEDEEPGKIFIPVHKFVLEVLAKGKKQNFLTGFFNKGYQKSSTIDIGKDYSSPAINTLLDFLYGVSKTYKAEDFQNLLCVLAMTDQLQLNELHEKCKAICNMLLDELPKLVFEAVTIPSNLGNPVINQFILPRLTPDVFKQLSVEEGKKFFNCVKNFPENSYFLTFTAICLDGGIGTAKDETQALKLYESASKQENPIAQWCLGNIYFSKGDYNKAIELYERSAEKDFAAAQCSLARCYEDGNGVLTNDDEAFRLYLQAADQGLAQAQFKLGWFYENAKHVSQDEKKAIYWYTKAAKQNDYLAQYRLGLFYEMGYGVEKNRDIAMDLYKKAAEQGHQYAQYKLGEYFDAISHLVNPEAPQMAIDWFTKAAEKGHVEAQYRLAKCCDPTTGRIRNAETAFKWYKAAADKGHAFAQYQLAFFYQRGIQVPVNMGEAIRLYTASAEQGCSSAQYELGKCFEKGEGVQQNLTRAVKWYEKSLQNSKWAGYEFTREADDRSAAIRRLANYNPNE